MNDKITLKPPFKKVNGRDDCVQSKEAMLDLVRFLARQAAEADYEALLKQEQECKGKRSDHPASKEGEPKL